jgi:hypothetical protein
VVAGSLLSGTIPDSWTGFRRLKSLGVTPHALRGALGTADRGCTDVSGTNISGALNAVGHLSALELLDLSSSRISGSLPAALGQLPELRTIDASYTGITGVDPGVFYSPRLDYLNLAGNNIPFDGLVCPLNGARVSVIVLDGVPWNNVRLSAVMACFLSGAEKVDHLQLRQAGIVGVLDEHLGLPPNATLRTLSLAQNRISGDDTSIKQTYFLASTVANVDVSYNPLPASLIVDWPSRLQLDVSGTNVTWCYDGTVLSDPNLQRVMLRGTVSGRYCRRDKEVKAISSGFLPCSGLPPPPSVDSFASIYCVQGLKRVFYERSGVTCPEWSTFPTNGMATFGVEDTFLNFFGCKCAEGEYWGYADIAGVNNESVALKSFYSLGENGTILSRRRCLPCPSGVQCSPLSTLTPPHALFLSTYPYPYLERSLFVYSRTVPCLHPAVCNKPPLDPLPVDWDDWVALLSTGRALDPGNAQFRCRDGHNSLTLMCDQCLPGYWSHGFLCEPCVDAFKVLVPMAIVVCVVSERSQPALACLCMSVLELRAAGGLRALRAAPLPADAGHEPAAAAGGDTGPVLPAGQRRHPPVERDKLSADRVRAQQRRPGHAGELRRCARHGYRVPVGPEQLLALVLVVRECPLGSGNGGTVAARGARDDVRRALHARLPLPPSGAACHQPVQRESFVRACGWRWQWRGEGADMCSG